MENSTRTVDESILDFVQHYESSSFEGYSVYDGFNSPLRHLLRLNSNLLNTSVIQFFKLFPRNVRPLFFVQQGVNPKSLGLALEGAVIRGADAEFVERVLSSILETRSEFTNCSWGYNWPTWTLRGGRFPKDYPNAVVTYFVANGLLELYSRAPDDRLARMIESTERFFLEDVNRTEDASGTCFSYSPMDRRVIYNASALITRFLIRKNVVFEEEENLPLIDSCISFLASRQNADGSWYYGDESSQKWIDSFHTEYMLELFMEPYASDRYAAEYEKGKAFYLDNFLSKKKICNYFPGRVYPVNVHSVASMLIFLAKCGLWSDAKPIVDWAFRNLYDFQGKQFFFEKRRFYTNRNVYHRWNQSWMYLALSYVSGSTNER